MGDEVRVRSLLEEVLNSGRTPEEVCSSHPDCLEPVRHRWLRIRDLMGDLERLLPSPGLSRHRDPAGTSVAQKALPRIPGYELTAMIGHGGMGVVYKAVHLKLDRVVAVKTLLAGDFASSKELESLLREAQTVAGLGHANIVEVYDAGEVDGLPYFTMEFVEGGSLAEKLAGVPLPPRAAAVLVERLAAAVQAAHDRGIVHRDLKPANILLTSDEIPKIADFGLARKTGGDSQRTKGSARFGTPSYMAPEQALGAPAAFDPSVDVYALGAILYEALTGRPPFRADSPVETQRQVISEEPVAPSRINRRVPRDVETICLKCLRKSPSARYASAHELNADLGRFLRGEPIAARKTGAVVRGAKWVRRHPTKTTLLGFAMLMMVVAIVGGAWRVATTAASRRLVENELGEVERSQRGSDWAAANSAMDRASVHLGSGGPVDLRSRLDAARRNALVVTSLEGVRVARALGSGSTESIDESDGGYTALYRDACNVTDAVPPEESARRIRASTIRAALIAGMYDWLMCVRGQPRRDWMLAILRIEDSDQGGWRDRSRDPAVWKDRDAVRSCIAESRVDGQSTEYLLWFAEVIRQLGIDPTPLLKKIQSAHADDFWANYMLAEALHRRGKDREAMRFIQAALAIRPDVAIAHNNLGNYLRGLYRFDESIAQLEEAVRLDPASPAIHGNLGLSFVAVGRHSEAMEHVEFGLRRWPDHGLFHAQLGYELLELDRDEEAVEHYRRAFELGPDSTAAKDEIVKGLVRAGHAAEAVSAYRSWIERGSGSFQQWDGVADFCVFVGAMKDYEETRTRLLETFGSSDEPVVCERLCRACMLAPISESQGRVASAAIDRALESEKRLPTSRAPYLKLVKAMAEYRAGRPEATLSLVDADVSKVLLPMPQMIRALALADLHRDAEGLASLAWAAAIGDWRAEATGNREGWMCQALRREAESKLMPRLDEFRRGTYWPTHPHERLVLLATSEDRGMHLASARMYTEAFAMDPALARDIGYQCRYRAACAAAKCGCERSSDGPAVAPEEQVRWRAQALHWLREDLAVLRDGSTNANRSVLLTKWRNDLDLRGIRDPARLAELPEGERSAFGALWNEVNGVLAATESD